MTICGGGYNKITKTRKRGILIKALLKNKKLLVAMILVVVLNVVFSVWLANMSGDLVFVVSRVLIPLLPCAALLLSMNGQRKKAIACMIAATILTIVEYAAGGPDAAFLHTVAVDAALLLFLCLKNKNRKDWIGVALFLVLLPLADLLSAIMRYGHGRYFLTWGWYLLRLSEAAAGVVCLFGFMDPHHEFSRPKSVVVTSAQAAYKWVRKVVKDQTKVTAFFRKVTNVMFTNIGGKIKTLTKVVCWIGIAASVIGGVVFMFDDEVLAGLAMIVGGVLASWVGSFILYAFGELVENVAVIAEMQVKADAEKHQRSEEN